MGTCVRALVRACVRACVFVCMCDCVCSLRWRLTHNKCRSGLLELALPNLQFSNTILPVADNQR